MIKMDAKEIWYWYQKVEERRKSGLPPKAYCKANNLEYKKFGNMLMRIEYKRETHPELYTKLVKIGRSYLASGLRASNFVEQNKINRRLLSEVVTHIGYIDAIEELKKRDEKMKFIQVPPQSPPKVPSIILPMPTEPEHEVIEKQNDIEINITKGVKVSISPNIDSMKIIKIIELLKDL